MHRFKILADRSGITAIFTGSIHHVMCFCMIHISAQMANISVGNCFTAASGETRPFMSSKSFREFMPAFAAAEGMTHGASDHVILIMPERRVAVMISVFNVQTAGALIYIIPIILTERIHMIHILEIMPDGRQYLNIFLTASGAGEPFTAVMSTVGRAASCALPIMA